MAFLFASIVQVVPEASAASCDPPPAGSTCVGFCYYNGPTCGCDHQPYATGCGSTDPYSGCTFVGPVYSDCTPYEDPCPPGTQCADLRSEGDEFVCVVGLTPSATCHLQLQNGNECLVTAGPVPSQPSVTCDAFAVTPCRFGGVGADVAVGTGGPNPVCIEICGPSAPFVSCTAPCSPMGYGVILRLGLAVIGPVCTGQLPNGGGSCPANGYAGQVGVVVTYPPPGTNVAVCVGPDTSCLPGGIGLIINNVPTGCIPLPDLCAFPSVGIDGIVCVAPCAPVGPVPTCPCPPPSVGVIVGGLVTTFVCQTLPAVLPCTGYAGSPVVGFQIFIPPNVPVCIGIDPACAPPSVGLYVNNFPTGCIGPPTICGLTSPGPGWTVGVAGTCVGAPWVVVNPGPTTPYCTGSGTTLTVAIDWGTTPGAPGPYTAFCI